ncbi:hypothetical protein O7631_19685 [Micromonospora sp. WMMD967]|uniref:hypothetical protein n=1 Tax=Micromonospora sp. WMMD967 TaxID=3016101 RepID=UPI002417EA81|nr:hypothetical protein [Micromonospora sp. WMMD967]MDG4838740.1 hypothetical protein [Micromonospora sp. WMMD967]
MTLVRGKLGFTDPRSFSLIGYRHGGHGYALFRGFPSLAEIEDGHSDSEFRVLDICFRNIERISCWAGGGPIHLRHPTDEEKDAIQARIGPTRNTNIYLLKPDSIEDYVVASAVYWAEYHLALTAPSPLVAEDKEGRDTHSPIERPVQFVDQPWTPYSLSNSTDAKTV